MPNEKDSSDKGRERNMKMPAIIKKEGLLSFFPPQIRQETASCIFLAAVAADLLVFIKHNFCDRVR